jgi:integrase
MRMRKVEWRHGKPSILWQAPGQRSNRYTGETEVDCQEWWLDRYKEYEAAQATGVAPEPCEEIRIPPSIRNTVGAMLVWFDATQVQRTPKSATTYRAKIRSLVRHCDFVEKPPLAVTPDDIDAYLMARAAASSVVSFERFQWCRIFDAARKHKMFGFTRTSPNPAKASEPIKVMVKKIRLLHDEDRERLFAELKATPIFDIATCALLTGLRRCEIVRVRVRHINFEAKVIALPEEKNGSEFEERVLWPEARAFLRERIAGKRPDDLVFPWSASIDRISQIFTAAAKRCGLSLSFHSLRKTYATEVHRRTGDIIKSMLSTGHKDAETFRKSYCGLTARDVARMI